MIAFEGKHPVRSKIVINEKVLKQVMNLTSGLNTRSNKEQDINKKLQSFQYMYDIKRCLIGKVRKNVINIKL